MFFYEVLVINKFCKKSYVYGSFDKIELFSLVKVEFGSKKCLGIIINNAEKIDNFKYIEKFLSFKINKGFIDFIYAFTSYYFLNIGAVLELCIPSLAFKKSELFLEYEYKDEIYELRELLDIKLDKKYIKKLKANQSTMKENCKIKFDEDQLNAVKFLKESSKVVLLNGVTGSGKTIVALKSIMDFKNKILILVPEINLSFNWIKVIKENFGINAHVYHSKMKEIYKKAFYNWAISDSSGFIIGTRSALMLPYLNLDAIIVDEEHSYSYKQENYPYYHARDMAVLRASFEKIKLILLSATPSLETVQNVISSKYNEYKLKRTPKYGLAQIEYVKGQYMQILSIDIIKQVSECFKRNQQVLFFLNRKGYSPYCICSNCKHVLSCDRCETYKTLYKDFKVVCHKCLKSQFLSKTCPNCNKITTWNFFGLGVEKVHDYLCSEFKNYTFKSVTCDSEGIDQILCDIESKKIDGIIATQVLAQGYDFSNIGLVVIIDGDMGLSCVNFRILEQVYQLWQQIRGRSGRHNIQGKMIIQYYNSENKFVTLFQKDNVYDYLLYERKKDDWPPFSKCAFLKFKGKNKEKLRSKVQNINLNKDFIFGPFYYGVCKSIYEFRFLIKCKNYAHLSKVLRMIQSEIPCVEIEVDPYSF